MAALTRKQRDRQKKAPGKFWRQPWLCLPKAGFTTPPWPDFQSSPVSAGTIYKYFPEKEMYHDLVIERVHELGRILYDIAHQQDVSVTDRLLAALKAQARFYRDNQDVVKIYISERSNIDSVGMPQLNERVNRPMSAWCSCLKPCLTRDPGKGVQNLPGPGHGGTVCRYRALAGWSGLFREEDPTQSDRRLSMIFEMFTTGIQK